MILIAYTIIGCGLFLYFVNSHGLENIADKVIKRHEEELRKAMDGLNL